MSATSGGAVDLSDLNGLFKKQFAPSLVDLKPDHCIVQDLIEWVPSDKLNGEFYAVPTVLRSNQGVTYLGESGAVGTLKSPKAGVMKEAQIKGSEINVRGQISYKTLSQAASKGAQAFEKSSAWLVNDLQETATIRLEIATLYGQTGLGIVESATDLTGGVANIVHHRRDLRPGPLGEPGGRDPRQLHRDHQEQRFGRADHPVGHHLEPHDQGLLQRDPGDRVRGR
jgi:hypothetical protein